MYGYSVATLFSVESAEVIQPDGKSVVYPVSAFLLASGVFDMVRDIGEGLEKSGN